MPIPTKLFLAKTKGARVWDVDGNEYIDFMGAAGPNILGHCHPEFVQILNDFMATMSPINGSGMLFTPIEIEVAEKIEEYVPCAEKVKFCVTGTEAVQMAIRLARAYTKRPYFIRFEGHYHGWLDNVLGGAVDTNKIKGVRDGTEGIGLPHGLDVDGDPCSTAGRQPGAFEQSFILPWNDIETLEKTLERYGDKVAMIHMEPIVVNHGCLPPLPGFMERVRELCDEYGVIMSFDEVITGFRTGLGGAQATLGVTPDIATFGKAMASGLPLSAVAGKSEIMNLLSDGTVLGPGTFNGYPLGMAAALATINILERDDGAVYKHIDHLQKRLMDGLREISNRRGIPLLIQGPRGAFISWTLDKEEAFTEKDLSGLDMDLLQKLSANLLEEGLLTMFVGRWYLSASHTEDDVDSALEIADKAIGRL